MTLVEAGPEWKDDKSGDRELITAAVAELFPAARWTATLTGRGFSARVYRIDWMSAGGRTGRIAARISDEGSGLLREHTICRDVLPFLAIEAPKVLGFFNRGGLCLSAREYLSGCPPWDAANPDYGRLLELMAGYHSVNAESAPPSWSGLYADYSPGTLQDAFAMLHEVLVSCQRTRRRPPWLTASLTGLSHRLACRASEIVHEILLARRCFVHGDAVPGNVLFAEPGGRPILVDWEQFGVYVPHVDVISALYHHDDEERPPLVSHYLSSCERLTGDREDADAFCHILDLVDLQRSAAIVATWLGRVMSGQVDEGRVSGFIRRRAAAIESAARRLGFTGK